VVGEYNDQPRGTPYYLLDDLELVVDYSLPSMALQGALKSLPCLLSIQAKLDSRKKQSVINSHIMDGA